MPERLSATEMVDLLHEAAVELEKAHLVLDGFGVPRVNPQPDGAEFTLAARIHYAVHPPRVLSHPGR